MCCCNKSEVRETEQEFFKRIGDFCVSFLMRNVKREEQTNSSIKMWFCSEPESDLMDYLEDLNYPGSLEHYSKEHLKYFRSRFETEYFPKALKQLEVEGIYTLSLASISPPERQYYGFAVARSRKILQKYSVDTIQENEKERTRRLNSTIKNARKEIENARKEIEKNMEEIEKSLKEINAKSTRSFNLITSE